MCASWPNYVRHVYTTVITEAWSFLGAGYSYDGIEGYIVPPSQPMPTGSTELWRAYNSFGDDYMLYPTEDQSWASSGGYTQNATVLGFVYRNSGNRPSY